ncbi:MAG: efflux RND transporter periplasmic adaptor subunit [Acidobacteria bacterium]|nr:efflux RND transporter periplasmic adaptor subunit [Acidobacteriota bacterium]
MREITIRVPDFTLRNMVLFALLLGGAVFIWYYKGRTVEPEHVHEESESGPGESVALTAEALRNADIKTLEVELRPLKESLEAAGRVEPDLNQVARVRALGRGIVRRVLVRPGDQVEAGQALFEYDNIEMGELLGEYKALLSQKGKLEARVRVTEQAAERARSLVAAQALAQKELELRIAEQREAQAELDTHTANLNAVAGKLGRFGMSPDRLMSSEASSLSSVKAPQSGVILDFQIAPGEVLSTDQEVMTIADLGRVWVIASVYERDLGRVKTGQTAEISFVSFPDRTFSGRITQVAQRLDPETRTAKVRVEVENRGQQLKLEMFGNVRLPTQDPTIVPAIPETALQQVDGKNAVFVQIKAQEFQRREIELGHKADGWVEVTHGLKPGERVVTQGSFYLKSTLLKDTLQGDH